MSEIRPENWIEIIQKNISIEWVKNNAKFYILSYSDSSSSAMIWKSKDVEERGWLGVRMKREYENGKGYFMDFEPFYMDIEWALNDDSIKKYDITSNFDEAIQLANLHTT